jgi:esterase/lipase
VIAAPLVYAHNKVDEAKYWKWLRPMIDMPDNSRLSEIIREEQQRRGEAPNGRTHYKRWSVGAVAELAKLTQVTREVLPGVSAPLSLIYAVNDASVSIDSIAYIRQHVQSTLIEEHIFNECGHIITQDVERDEAFEVVEAFFRHHVSTLTE